MLLLSTQSPVGRGGHFWYADCRMVFQVLHLSAVHSTSKWGTHVAGAGEKIAHHWTQVPCPAPAHLCSTITSHTLLKTPRHYSTVMLQVGGTGGHRHVRILRMSGTYSFVNMRVHLAPILAHEPGQQGVP